MKQVLLQLASYNIWANHKMTECIHNLTGDQVNREIVSSFPSVYKTMLHIWDAESIWWQRIKLAEHLDVPSENFHEDIEALCKKLAVQSKLWEEWIGNASEIQLSHVFAYQNSKREQFKQPVYEMLLHLFNHGTYHRGQLVTMFRQLGVEKIPQTDLIVFCRKK